MPLYKFICSKCGKKLELLEKNNPRAPKCEKCNIEMERTLGRPSIKIK